MRRLLFCTALVLVICASALPLLAADLPRGDARQAGFAPARLALVTDLLEQAVTDGRIAGAGALVARRGQVVYEAYVGQRDQASGAPIAEDTLYRLASMTKPITSVAAMLLVEEGRLALDDPLAKYVPEFSQMRVLAEPAGAGPGLGQPADATPPAAGPPATVAAQRAITIRDLLCHTSGLTYQFFDRPPLAQLYADAGVIDGIVESALTLDENVRRLAGLPLICQPGTAFEYGLSTDVLGRVTEVASGQPLDVFFASRIFAPLEMRDTHFLVPPDDRERLATLYAAGPDGQLQPLGDKPVQIGRLAVSSTYSTADDNSYRSGGAGLAGPIGDYYRFLAMLLAGGRAGDRQLLQPATVAAMTSNQIGELSVPFPGHGSGFGLGLGVVTAAPPAQGPFSQGTYSWGGLFSTYFWVDPEQELIGLLMTQVLPPSDLRLEFADAVYAALETE